jgi:hypothetical protein
MGLVIMGYSYFTVSMSLRRMRGWQFSIRNNTGPEDVAWRAQRE